MYVLYSLLLNPTLIITFFKGLSNLYLILKILYIEIFKLYKIKELKLLLLPKKYVKPRENVIGGCAITRD